MMKIAVASGKGGTGKTMVSVAMAEILGSDSVLVDLDVEEPNAGLYFFKAMEKSHRVHRMIPAIEYERCDYCGICAEVCAFNAMVVLPAEIMIFPELCHSCASCYYNCPQAAIFEGKHPIGSIEEHLLANGVHLIMGRLIVGEAQSPPLIKAVKMKAAQHSGLQVVFDCPPGVGCSTLEAIRGSDYCLLVTEPTPFGCHDLRLALEAVNLLGIPAGVIINRWRGSDAGIDTLADQFQVPVLERIPFSRALASAFAEGEHPLTAMPELRGILEGLLNELQVIAS